MQPTETGGTLESSALGRLIGVLTSPGKTFRSIAERPTWAAPLLLLVLLTSGVGYLVAQRLDMEQAIRQRLAGRQELSQEQMDKAVAQGKKYGPIAALASGVVVTPIGYLLAAALFFTLFRLLGSEVDYVRSLAVWLHGLMPWAIATLLALPIVLSRAKLDPTTAQRGLLLSNLAAPRGPGRASSPCSAASTSSPCGPPSSSSSATARWRGCRRPPRPRWWSACGRSGWRARSGSWRLSDDRFRMTACG